MLSVHIVWQNVFQLVVSYVEVFDQISFPLVLWIKTCLNSLAFPLG